MAGAYAVIFDGAGDVLFCHRRDCDFWNLPGGGVESGEAPWQAVVRLAGLYSWTALDEVIYSFVCRVIGGALLTHTDEADDARYFALDNLPANTFIEHAARACDAALGQPQTILRIPTGPTGREQARQSNSG